MLATFVAVFAAVVIPFVAVLATFVAVFNPVFPNFVAVFAADFITGVAVFTAVFTPFVTVCATLPPVLTIFLPRSIPFPTNCFALANFLSLPNFLTLSNLSALIFLRFFTLANLSARLGSKSLLNNFFCLFILFLILLLGCLILGFPIFANLAIPIPRRTIPLNILVRLPIKDSNF